MTPNLSKAARSLLNWNQEDLAARPLVSKRTIAAFEAGETARNISLDAIERAFKAAGIMFVETPAETGVLLSRKVRSHPPRQDVAKGKPRQGPARAPSRRR
jgi:transcriptional regulator with XRE-family HTH domain